LLLSIVQAPLPPIRAPLASRTQKVSCLPTLSLANLMVPDADPLQQIEAASAAGFRAVGLSINPPDRLGAALVREPAQRRLVKSRLAALDMRVLDIEIFPLLPEIDVASLSPALEAGAELGAEFVLVTGNDADEQRACDNYAKLCDLAGAIGMRPMLEFIPYRQLRDIGQAERWLRRVGHASAGMCVDALHLFRSGGTLDDLRHIEPRHIGYAQLCDAASMQPAHCFSEQELVRESRTHRRLPGEGVLPLAAFLAALPPGLAISVEAPCEDYAHLSVRQRAALAMQTSRGLVASYERR
jgi:sugar phosphate isomerase/epimerase